MTILEALNQAKVTAMKAKVGAGGADLEAANLRLDTIRDVIAEIDKDSKLTNARTELAVVKAEHSKRVASAKLYADLGETYRSECESAEAEVLAEFIPTKATETELREFITAVVAASDGLAGTGGKAVGVVMKALNSEFDNFDGKLASQLIREIAG